MVIKPRDDRTSSIKFFKNLRRARQRISTAYRMVLEFREESRQLQQCVGVTTN